MNKIINGLLDDFKNAQNIDSTLSESETFELFSAYLSIGSIAESSSSTNQTVVGGDAQPAVDAIGVIVNGTLIENEDEIETYVAINSYLDIDFVFTQAKTSENFDGSALSDLGSFADDFIEEDSCKTDTEAVSKLRKIKNLIYKQAKYFKHRNPNIHLFYVTTGQEPENDINFNKRIKKIKDQFEKNGNINECQIYLIGSREIQKLKRQLDHSISKEISFGKRIALPQTPGIDEAYLGVIPATDYIHLLTGQGNNFLTSIFYDNVRDWQGSNTVNSGIANTIQRENSRSRFVFMNNGITVIARKIRVTGEKINLEDYQIVNGCQTSNVLWNNRSSLNESVLIPLRIVATTDEEIVRDIIKATNSQTEVTPSQLLAATDFQKQLEQFFQNQQPVALFYERRSRQFTNSTIDRSKIVTPISLMKAFASIVLNEPHKTTRDFQSVLAAAGKTLFGSTHKLEPYYMAAVVQYWCDYFLRKGLIDKKLTVARFQIMLAFRLLNQSSDPPSIEANKIKKWSNDLSGLLKDQDSALIHLKPAAELVGRLIKPKKNPRDAARTSAFTEEVIKATERLTKRRKSQA